jgi:hypothetical protein
MPVYGSPQSGGVLTALAPGDTLTLFGAAESLTAPVSSIAFARQMGPGETDAGTTFTIDFAAAPTSSVLIQGSNQDIDATYQTLLTSSNKQHDNLTDTGRWKYYRAQLASQSAGGAVTVIAQR